jgi:hypothetical protein
LVVCHRPWHLTYRGRRAKSETVQCVSVRPAAQLIEYVTSDHRVAGSSPAGCKLFSISKLSNVAGPRGNLSSLMLAHCLHVSLSQSHERLLSGYCRGLVIPEQTAPSGILVCLVFTRGSACAKKRTITDRCIDQMIDPQKQTLPVDS